MNVVLSPERSEGATALDANRVCQECGLCCNGTLFSFAKVYPEELKKTKALGIDVFKDDADGTSKFNFPCPAFINGNCSVYLQRPKKCQSYYCKLQENVMNGTIKVEDGLKIVHLVHKHSKWIRQAIVSKDKPDLNYRELLRKYYKIATNKNERGELSLADEGRIRRIFEQVKLIDRFFEGTSMLRKYAGLIQSFKCREKLDLD